ncbi:RNA polymerase sigma factor (sigma-70 family) [Pedobacter sp. UYP30]|uniref:sigma factor-like helix-turn-helix DNA-binding protein n=1 Tax=Pedobacter sp. UYP30 TaxID=1756400 RepID=UPI00339B23CB
MTQFFGRLWANRKTVHINAVKGYLTAASRYQVCRHIAATKIIPIDYKFNVEGLSNRTVSSTGYERLTTTDLDTELHSSLDDLPKTCREIFLMSRKQTLSNEEIAGRLGMSKRSVENQITFTLKHLRGALEHISVLVIFPIGW